MKVVIIIRLVLLIFIIVCNITPGQSNPNKSSQRKSNLTKIDMNISDNKLNISSANNAFGLNIYRQLTQKQNGQNVFISPFSLSSALSMLASGAKGQTLENLHKVLNLPLNVSSDTVNKDYFSLVSQSQLHLSDTELMIANAFYTNNSLPVYPSYISLCQKFYSADCQSLDFDDVSSLNKINDWVATHTNNKITKIISTLSGDAVLLNAIYFKAKWLSPFEQSQTQLDKFKLTNNKTINIPMMNNTNYSRYYENPNFQAICLNYVTDSTCRYSAYVFLPKDNISLNQIEQTFTPSNINSWLELFDTKYGQLKLPKFKIDYSKNLNNSLQELGLKTIFNSPNFSAISKTPLKVTDVIHKTYLQVDETGSQAAAVTEIGMIATGERAPNPNQKPFKMIVNRPFIFMIYDNQTKLILFVGSIYHPEKI